MNINAVISQRLKLATKDLSYGADFKNVLMRIILQGRIMTEGEAIREHLEIYYLYDKSRKAFQNLNANHDDFFKEKLLSLNPSEDQLTHLTVQVAEQVLQYNRAGNVHRDGFLPKSLRLELEYLIEANEQGNAGKIQQERMLDMLTHSLRLLSVLSLKDSHVQTKAEQQAQSTDFTVENKLAVKSLTALRDEGKLHDYWANVTDEQIEQLLDFVRKDETLRKSSKQINQKWIDELLMEYAQLRSENAADVFEMDTADIEARHLLSIAVIRNLKATGKLTGGMELMTDEDLALAAYIGTEMNFYFDEAAAGKLSFEDYYDLVSDLLLSVISLFMAYLLLLLPFNPLQAIGVAIYGVCGLVLLCHAVSQFLNDLFPAGVSETRLGVFVKATAKAISYYAAVTFDKLFGRSPHADSHDDDVSETDFIADSDWKEDEADYEHEDAEHEHGGFEPISN